MNITITGKELKATEAIKDYAEKKLTRLEKYYGDENIDCNVTIKKESTATETAEMYVTVRGFSFKAVTEDKDLYAAIDKDIDILEGQIRKQKTKNDKQNITESIRVKGENQIQEVEEESEIIKTIFYSIKPLTEEDAKLILESDPKNKFLPFIDADTNRVCVIYKLKDGKNFGLLEPEA
jgi:putative sigma-54 modulation protein